LRSPHDGQHIATAGDVIKDPFVLEFLDLHHPPSAHERDLEQAIIDRLEALEAARTVSPSTSGTRTIAAGMAIQNERGALSLAHGPTASNPGSPVPTRTS
jgi:hypothetical protein